MVHETNTTEIPHVGTYAGHTGHRLRRPLWWKGYRPRVRPLCGSPKVPSGSLIPCCTPKIQRLVQMGFHILPGACSVEAMKSCFLDIINGTALPPHQVGVWIPKAKIGPEADCFRPLGMPNTLERLVDGSVAAHAMRQTAHTMHPSQAVMSCFKEPQKASPGGGCGPPRGMALTGRGGPARVRGDVKLRFSAGVTLKTPVPNEP